MLGVLSDCIWKVSVRSFAIELLWQTIFRDLANINFSDTIQAVLGSWSVETSENVSAQKTAEVWKQKNPADSLSTTTAVCSLPALSFASTDCGLVTSYIRY